MGPGRTDRAPLAPGPNPGRRVGVFAGAPGQPLERFRRLSHFSFRGALRGIDSGVDWSAAGDRILFDRYLFCASAEDLSCPVHEEYGESDVYIVQSRGKPRRRRLTRGGFSGEPIFSPDGTRLAAVRGAHIETRPLAGGRWTIAVRNGLSPAWQPVTAGTRFR